jgi:hypothetical protein
VVHCVMSSKGCGECVVVLQELRQSPGRDIGAGMIHWKILYSCFPVLSTSCFVVWVTDPAVEANLTPIVRKRLQSMTNSSSVASLPVVTMSATTPIAASSKPSLPPLHRASSNRSPSPEPPALVSARPAASPPPWMQTLQSAIENVANTLQEMNSRVRGFPACVLGHWQQRSSCLWWVLRSVERVGRSSGSTRRQVWKGRERFAL